MRDHLGVFATVAVLVHLLGSQLIPLGIFAFVGVFVFIVGTGAGVLVVVKKREGR